MVLHPLDVVSSMGCHKLDNSSTRTSLSLRPCIHHKDVMVTNKKDVHSQSMTYL